MFGAELGKDLNQEERQRSYQCGGVTGRSSSQWLLSTQKHHTDPPHQQNKKNKWILTVTLLCYSSEPTPTKHMTLPFLKKDNSQ